MDLQTDGPTDQRTDRPTDQQTDGPMDTNYDHNAQQTDGHSCRGVPFGNGLIKQQKNFYVFNMAVRTRKRLKEIGPFIGNIVFSVFYGNVKE